MPNRICAKRLIAASVLSALIGWSAAAGAQSLGFVEERQTAGDGGLVEQIANTMVFPNFRGDVKSVSHLSVARLGQTDAVRSVKVLVERDDSNTNLFTLRAANASIAARARRAARALHRAVSTGRRVVRRGRLSGDAAPTGADRCRDRRRADRRDASVAVKAWRASGELRCRRVAETGGRITRARGVLQGAWPETRVAFSAPDAPDASVRVAARPHVAHAGAGEPLAIRAGRHAEAAHEHATQLVVGVKPAAHGDRLQR